MSEQAFTIAAFVLGSEQLATKLFKSLQAAGYVCVPIEPTPEMIDAGWADAHEEDARGTWRSMTEAALSCGCSSDKERGGDM